MQLLPRLRLNSTVVLLGRRCHACHSRGWTAICFSIARPKARLATQSSFVAKLDLVAIDKKWQERWRRDECRPRARPDSSGKKKPSIYVLSMFPYPSGALHMGHLRVYTISDVLARFYRMRGYDVLHPMGWDAFGLPAENAAIERGVDPATWTEANIAKMKEQLRSISTQLDWDRELATCAPEFYEHTQRIFLMLYEKGLAYRAEAVVNYDPVDKTVLANEQVDSNGFSWRSGAKVEQLKLKQWFFRITAFKEALLKDLDLLSGGWPERVLSMQRNWLGKSAGAKVKFAVVVDGQENVKLDIDVFTTRPDTLYGVEYLALSVNHPLVIAAAEKDAGLQKFLATASSLPPDSKAGYKLSNVIASHPMLEIDRDSRHLAGEIPVFAAPYVLSNYGEGAVMGVPAHDSRDLLFFKENMIADFISIAIRPDSAAEAISYTNEDSIAARDAAAFTPEGILTSRCGKYKGLKSDEAAERIVNDLKQAGRGDFAETWRLRDWLISRQRYWGTPIPIIYCGHCGPVPVPKDQLPVRLPKLEGDWLKGRKGNPLQSSEEWVRTECPSCKRPARRETDTMDTFVDSSWYFLRYLDPRNKELPVSPAVVRPVDIYIGGVEHAILHLLYARFIYKFLSQSELFPKAATTGELSGPPEPFKTLLSQGMVHGKTFSDPATGRFLLPSEIDATNTDKPFINGTAVPANVSFEKMSKSKHNGVDPTGCVLKYGADATRAHVLFAAPVSEVLEWDEAKIVGIQRWFGRLWKITFSAQQTMASMPLPIPAGIPFDLEALSDADVNTLLSTHSAILSVTTCFEKTPYGLNTVISDLIKLTNQLAATPPTTPHVLSIALSNLIRLLAPIAPALASECWEVLNSGSTRPSSDQLGKKIASVFDSSWPLPLLSDAEVHRLSACRGQTVAVQVNGKLRFTAVITRMLAPKALGAAAQSKLTSPEQDQDWILGQILATDQGRLWLREKNEWDKRKRVIVANGGKLVNVVF